MDIQTITFQNISLNKQNQKVVHTQTKHIFVITVK